MKAKSGSRSEPSEEFKKFDELARKLVQVPKKEIDEKMAEQDHQKLKNLSQKEARR